ncbi:MAG: DUF4197 domain-containing protein [Gallionellaceae bacterium]|nr:DUF4197 domain-containing protein [Gallionellaceae bacterium]
MPKQPPKRVLLTALLFCLSGGSAQAGWWDKILEKTQQLQGKPAAEAVTSALSDDEVIRGLKEALGKGAEQAVSRLGKEGGFLNDLNVKIPMPEDLKKAEKVLRTFRQDKYADEFVATMNHAAERAVPEAAVLLNEAIQQMNLDDARAILKGPDDAATQYFRKTSEARLNERFLPLVQQATNQAGVTSAYKQLMQKAGPVASLMGKQANDVDGYVSGKAIDGLFKMMAAEEKLIRQDPLARGTDLLKKVFGSLKK